LAVYSIFAAFKKGGMGFRLPLLIASVLILASCKKSETPSFLHIEHVDLKVRPFNGNFNEFEGTADHNIVDAWVYLNDVLVGSWEVPARVPLIASGNQKITIIAGIKNNGISSARVDYAFYDLYSTNLTLIPDQTIDFKEDPNSVLINGKYSPFVQYFPSGLVFWNERFEDPGTQFDPVIVGQPEFIITQNPANVFNYNPGNDSQGSGYIQLTPTNNLFEITSTHQFNPQKGQKVYLEMHYKSNCRIQVGVYEKAPGDVKVYGKGLNPNSIWTKVYIELTDEVARRVNATSYSLFIEGFFEETSGTGEVFLDNIKLIYPE
jgi:hypothetical protein